jgi:2-amino-4-hydroxy-6-hydroxymethyldihydropteridine diphosphokinase
MVLIGLGSNRGDSAAIVAAAIARLEQFAAAPIRRSRLWRTSTVDCPPGAAPFINAAVAFEPRPEISPEMLLKALKAIEAEFGRTASSVRNAPRELDLDLLLFHQEVRELPHFTLPHPRAVNRLFVLAPAAEVLPDAVWPRLDLTIRQLLAALDTDEQVEPILPSERAELHDAH